MCRWLALLLVVACTPSRGTPDAAPPPPAASASSNEDTDAAKLQAEADELQRKMIEALGDGSNVGSSDLKIRSNDPWPSARGVGLAGVDSRLDAGASTPTGRVSVDASTSAPPVANADRVIAGLRARARNCYNQGLANDAGMHGVVSVALTVDAKGEVATADVTANNGGSVSSGVLSCITRAFKGARFDPPASPARLTVSLTLTPGP